MEQVNWLDDLLILFRVKPELPSAFPPPSTPVPLKETAVTFGPRSLAQLATCEQPIRDVFTEVDRRRPCTIIEGARSQADQDRDFDKGVSKLRWPHGKHNVVPPATLSRAVDVKPDDLAWTAPPEAWKVFADLVFQVALEIGIKLRWGGAWNGIYPNPPHDLNDYDHFELAT